MYIYTVSGESPVSEGEELKDFSSIDNRSDRRVRARNQGDDGLTGERPVGSHHALTGFRNVDVLEEELSVNLDVEDSPAVRARAPVVLEVKRDVVESVS